MRFRWNRKWNHQTQQLDHSKDRDQGARSSDAVAQFSIQIGSPAHDLTGALENAARMMFPTAITSWSSLPLTICGVLNGPLFGSFIPGCPFPLSPQQNAVPLFAVAHEWTAHKAIDFSPVRVQPNLWEDWNSHRPRETVAKNSFWLATAPNAPDSPPIKVDRAIRSGSTSEGCERDRRAEFLGALDLRGGMDLSISTNVVMEKLQSDLRFDPAVRGRREYERGYYEVSSRHRLEGNDVP